MTFDRWTHRALLACLAAALVLPALGDEAVPTPPTPGQKTALAKAERQQKREGREIFAEDLGFSPQDTAAIQQAKSQKRAIRDGLETDLRAVLHSLKGGQSNGDQVSVAATKTIRTRDQALAEMAAIDQALIAQVGADRDPKKLTALMILSAVDNGLRSNLRRLAASDKTDRRIGSLACLGFSSAEIAATRQAARQEVALQLGLRQDSVILSSALESAVSAPEKADQAAAEFLAVRDRRLAEMDAIERTVISQVGADRDPRKLAGLLAVGVVDNGWRSLCALKNGASGGAPGGSDAAVHVRRDTSVASSAPAAGTQAQ